MDFQRYNRRIYIVSEGDDLSEQKAIALEMSKEPPQKESVRLSHQLHDHHCIEGTVLCFDNTSRQTSTPNSSHNTTLRISLIDSMHLSSLSPPSCEESEMGRYFDTQWPRNLFRAVHYSILEQGPFHDNNDLMI